jgi:hypothetical protein
MPNQQSSREEALREAQRRLEETKANCEQTKKLLEEQEIALLAWRQHRLIIIPPVNLESQ